MKPPPSRCRDGVTTLEIPLLVRVSVDDMVVVEVEEEGLVKCALEEVTKAAPRVMLRKLERPPIKMMEFCSKNRMNRRWPL